jgi:hypothetical protein
MPGGDEVANGSYLGVQHRVVGENLSAKVP